MNYFSGDYSEVQRLVIDVGANVNHHEPGQQNTPLHIVAQMGITNTSNGNLNILGALNHFISFMNGIK